MLRIRQSLESTPGQLVKQSMHIPFRVALHGRDGTVGEERLVELKDAETLVRFEGQGVPSLNRGFTAPVTVEAATWRCCRQPTTIPSRATRRRSGWRSTSSSRA